jgi:hypothetical protein
VSIIVMRSRLQLHFPGKCLTKVDAMFWVWYLSNRQRLLYIQLITSLFHCTITDLLFLRALFFIILKT